MQQREAYFGYTAAPGGSCAVLVPVEPPSSAWPASSVPLRSYRARAVVVGWRKSWTGWSPDEGRRSDHRGSRRQSEGVSRDPRECGCLKEGNGRASQPAFNGSPETKQ